MPCGTQIGRHGQGGSFWLSGNGLAGKVFWAFVEKLHFVGKLYMDEKYLQEFYKYLFYFVAKYVMLCSN